MPPNRGVNTENDDDSSSSSDSGGGFFDSIGDAIDDAFSGGSSSSSGGSPPGGNPPGISTGSNPPGGSPPGGGGGSSGGGSSGGGSSSSGSDDVSDQDLIDAGMNPNAGTPPGNSGLSGGSSGGGGGSSGGGSSGSGSSSDDSSGGGSSGGGSSGGSSDGDSFSGGGSSPGGGLSGGDDIAGGSGQSTGSSESIADQIADLEPGEVLYSQGSGGTGDPTTERISQGENIRRTREAQLIARTDITRDELEARQEFEEQQQEYELLGRIQADVEDELGEEAQFDPEDVEFTEEVTPTGELIRRATYNYDRPDYGSAPAPEPIADTTPDRRVRRGPENLDLRLTPTAQEAQTLDTIQERAGEGLLTSRGEQVLQDVSTRYTAPAADFVVDMFSAGENNQNVIVDDPLRAIGENAEADALERTVADFSGSAAQSVGTIIDFPQIALGAERAVELGQGATRTAQDQGARPVGEALTTATRGAAVRAGRQAQQNPAAAAGGLLADVALGFGAGRAAGLTGQIARDRVRTFGATDITEDVTNPGTLEFYNNRGQGVDESDRFPGAQDPELYQRDSAAAVRQQADEFTPEAVTETFEEAGVTDGSVIKKAMDVEPEGPDTSTLQRSGGGFTAGPGDYELPGAFFGPEVSPNFFRTGRRSGFRPGLIPDFGGRPTAVLARTDVENPRARTMAELGDELAERAGEPVALGRASPNPGEIEAIVPEGAQFRDISAGPAQRLGIGSDFFVRSGGRRIPVRLVAPDRDVGDVDISDFSFGQVGTLNALSERLRPRVDRPSPVSTPSLQSSRQNIGRSRRRSPSTSRSSSLGFSSISSVSSFGSGSGSSSSTASSSGSGSSSSSSSTSSTTSFSTSSTSSGGSGFTPTPITPTPPTPRMRRSGEEFQRQRSSRQMRERSTIEERDPLAIGYLAETFAGFAGLDATGEAISVSQTELQRQSGEAILGEFTPTFTSAEAQTFDDTLSFFGLDDDQDSDFSF